MGFVVCIDQMTSNVSQMGELETLTPLLEGKSDLAMQHADPQLDDRD